MMRKVFKGLLIGLILSGHLSLYSCSDDGEKLDRAGDFKDRGFTNN